MQTECVTAFYVGFIYKTVQWMCNTNTIQDSQVLLSGKFGKVVRFLFLLYNSRTTQLDPTKVSLILLFLDDFASQSANRGWIYVQN